MRRGVIHPKDCPCERCCRYRELERTEEARARAEIAARNRGPFPFVKYVGAAEMPDPTPPREYRRSHDGTLKPVVSKGCRGCHQKKG